jgi:TolB-like protein/Flp pilus assembly protein TadD
VADSSGDTKASVRAPVFISYASQDAEAAKRICDALRSAGIEVWFDQSELRGGDVWDRQIRQQIHDCRLFIPIVSANTDARVEGYFRREWKLAVDRTHDLSERVAFLVPIVIDSTSEAKADVPDAFRHVQWTRLPGGTASSAFVERIRRLVTPVTSSALSIVTAHPEHGTAQISTTANGPRRVAWVALWAGSGVVALGLAYFVANRFWLPRHTPAEEPVAAVAPAPTPAMPAIPEKSVAVLPFVDMSEKKDQEYFSDGLSEELIDQLAHFPDLKVIARTSSFQFKGKNEDMRSIGQRLGVANLLEGSVRTSGKTLRVTAQLIKATDGSHLWSQTYDRDMGDIFKVQDSIAAAVVSALKVALTARTSSSQDQSSDTDAYAAYLRGRYFLRKHTKNDLERALSSFEESVRIDPRYAAAWAEIGFTYNAMGIEGLVSPNEAYRNVRKAAEYALSIDPNQAMAYAVLGAYEWNYMHDVKGARAYLEKARALDPALDTNIATAGLLATIDGRVDDAIALLRQGTNRDPLNDYLWESLGYALLFAGSLPEAERAARNVIELNPSYGGAHCGLGYVLLAEKKPDAALAIMKEETDPDSQWCTADALWALGRRADADAVLVEAKTKYANSQAVGLADSYALRNESDEAFKWLERAYENREPAATVIGADPQLRSLREDPRFAALLHKMNQE